MSNQKSNNHFVLFFCLLLGLTIFPLIFKLAPKTDFNNHSHLCLETKNKVLIFRNDPNTWIEYNSEFESSKINLVTKKKLLRGLRKEIKKVLPKSDQFVIWQVYDLQKQKNEGDTGQIIIVDQELMPLKESEYVIACLTKLINYKNGILPSRKHIVYKAISLEYVNGDYFSD